MGSQSAGSLQPFLRGSSWPPPEELVSHTGKRYLGILTERGLAPLGAGVGDDRDWNDRGWVLGTRAGLAELVLQECPSRLRSRGNWPPPPLHFHFS